MTDNLTLEDLVQLSGLPLRTLRYYMQEGILQGPDSHGKYARYSQQHLDRLELIQRLKSLRLPIQEIRHLLENMTPEEISKVRVYQDVMKSIALGVEESPAAYPTPKSSALEYIQNLEYGRQTLRSYSKNPPSSPAPSTPAQAPLPSPSRSASQRGQGETWTRIVLAAGIELHVQQSAEKQNRREIEELIEFAKNIL